MDRFLISSKLKRTVFAILLSLGLIFLVFSEYDFMGTEDKNLEAFDENEYILHLETRLAEIIEKMEGISEVNVMITLERGTEYQYTQATAASGELTASENSSFHLQTASNNGEKPVFVAASSPIVKGVSVVCRGADGAVMQNKIISLIASTLNLNQNQIYVTT